MDAGSSPAEPSAIAEEDDLLIESIVAFAADLPGANAQDQMCVLGERWGAAIVRHMSAEGIWQVAEARLAGEPEPPVDPDWEALLQIYADGTVDTALRRLRQLQNSIRNEWRAYNVEQVACGGHVRARTRGSRRRAYRRSPRKTRAGPSGDDDPHEPDQQAEHLGGSTRSQATHPPQTRTGGWA